VATVLVVAGRSRAQIYDVRHPARPALVQEVAVADLVSAGVELAPGDYRQSRPEAKRGIGQ